MRNKNAQRLYGLARGKRLDEHLMVPRDARQEGEVIVVGEVKVVV